MPEGKDLIAYCGLYCGDCHGYKGKIPDLARDLRKELRQAKFNERAEKCPPILSLLPSSTTPSAMSFWELWSNSAVKKPVAVMAVRHSVR